MGCSFPPDTDTPQLADENRYKPKETKAISGTIKPLSAERVAKSIVEGIEKERFAIVPDASTRALAKVTGLLPGRRREGDGPRGAQGAGERRVSSVAQLGDDREVVGAPHAVDRNVARDLRAEHVADAAELRVADHHVVDAAVEVEARGRERVVVRPRVAGLRVAARLPTRRGR